MIAAYKLPKETEDEVDRARAARSSTALVGRRRGRRARTADVAIQILDLVERIVPLGNVNVISDGAAAARRGPRGASRRRSLNIDANVASITDSETRETYERFAAGAIERDLDARRRDRCGSARPDRPDDPARRPPAGRRDPRAGGRRRRLPATAPVLAVGDRHRRSRRGLVSGLDREGGGGRPGSRCARSACRATARGRSRAPRRALCRQTASTGSSA